MPFNNLEMEQLHNVVERLKQSNSSSQRTLEPTTPEVNLPNPSSTTLAEAWNRAAAGDVLPQVKDRLLITPLLPKKLSASPPDYVLHQQL